MAIARSLAKLLLLTFVTFLVGCDHATKHAAQTMLAGKKPLALVPGWLDLRYAENHDSAFSLFARAGVHGMGPWLGLLASLVLVVLLVMWVRRRHEASRLEHLGFAFAVAGALGNIADRLLRGYVVDFIHIRYWPVFNVADIAVVVGVALITLASLRDRPGSSPQTS
jgi:signal peptidase II